VDSPAVRVRVDEDVANSAARWHRLVRPLLQPADGIVDIAACSGRSSNQPVRASPESTLFRRFGQVARRFVVVPRTPSPRWYNPARFNCAVVSPASAALRNHITAALDPSERHRLWSTSTPDWWPSPSIRGAPPSYTTRRLRLVRRHPEARLAEDSHGFLRGDKAAIRGSLQRRSASASSCLSNVPAW